MIQYERLIASELIFVLIESKGMTYTIIYIDDSTFFLRDISSVKMLAETFKQFSCFHRLKPHITKWKGFLEAVCDLKTVDLTTDAIKI